MLVAGSRRDKKFIFACASSRRWLIAGTRIPPLAFPPFIRHCWVALADPPFLRNVSVHVSGTSTSRQSVRNLFRTMALRDQLDGFTIMKLQEELQRHGITSMPESHTACADLLWNTLQKKQKPISGDLPAEQAVTSPNLPGDSTKQLPFISLKTKPVVHSPRSAISTKPTIHAAAPTTPLASINSKKIGSTGTIPKPGVGASDISQLCSLVAMQLQMQQQQQAAHQQEMQQQAARQQEILQKAA